MYENVSQEYRKLSRQHMALTVVVRRLHGDQQKTGEKLDRLQVARFYFADRINELEEHVAKLSTKQSQVDAKEASKKSKDDDEDEVSLEGEDRIEAIRKAVKDLKANLLWGKFIGTPQELETIMKEVDDLLNTVS